MTPPEQAAPSELLPCPFCGSPAKKGWSMIHCTKCWAVMHDPHGDEKYHLEMWNRRAALAAQAPQEGDPDFVEHMPMPSDEYMAKYHADRAAQAPQAEPTSSSLKYSDIAMELYGEGFKDGQAAQKTEPVEPVAYMYTHPNSHDVVVTAKYRWTRYESAWTETPLGPIAPPAVAQQDADRYQFMRSEKPAVHELLLKLVRDKSLTLEAMDRTIDAAIAAAPSAPSGEERT